MIQRKQSIYLMHPIQEQNKDDVIKWYNKTIEKLCNNYNLYYPILDVIRTTKEYDKENPTICNSAIVTRDLHYASDADILFVDFTNSNVASIGCCFELAVGYWNHKHLIAVIPENNIHEHCFIKHCCSVIFNNYDDAIDYLLTISK